MNGWISVAFLVAAQLAAAVFLVRRAARRWWDTLVIAVLTALLVGPTAQHVTGDISKYLPDATWSGPDDKEQIIYASIASTILLPPIASALAVLIFKALRRIASGAAKPTGS
jgi:hypothetical protein